MVNKRLGQYRENNKLITNIQCVFRSIRSTLDRLIRLDTFIKQAMAKEKYTVGIFFDLEKAYDTTWRYGILKAMHQQGVRRRLPTYIQKFMKEATFQVTVNGIKSKTCQQGRGVPQRSISSASLFAIKINSLASIIPKDVLASLFVDDLQIAYSYHNMNDMNTELQQAIDSISQWALNNGFKFSNTKTVRMTFYKEAKPVLQPKLKINAFKISAIDSTKFLGLHWDKKMTWNVHINQLKAKCMSSLNLMRTLSGLHWSTDQETLMRVYRMVIKSKLDYGSAVYGSTSNVLLNSLEVVQNEDQNR